MTGQDVFSNVEKQDLRPQPSRQPSGASAYDGFALSHEGWMASTKVTRPAWVTSGATNPDPAGSAQWELYNAANDGTQNRDLAAKCLEDRFDGGKMHDAW